MREVRWERLTAPEVKEWAARDAVVILPVAALEQHGPHLPVWTDSLIGHASCIRAAELVAEDAPALVLPPMWQGISEHHLPFGGTISLMGVLTGFAETVPTALILRRNIKVQGIYVGNVAHLAALLRAVRLHRLRPVVDQVFAWEDAPDAYRHLESAKHFGKVVIKIGR